MDIRKTQIMRWKELVRTWIKKQSVEFFHEGFEKLVHRWHKSEENSGNYVEK